MKPTDLSASPGNAARRPSLFEVPSTPPRTPHREIAIFAPFEDPKPQPHSPYWAKAGVLAIFSAALLLAAATLWATFNHPSNAPPLAQPVLARPAGDKPDRAAPVTAAQPPLAGTDADASAPVSGVARIETSVAPQTATIDPGTTAPFAQLEADSAQPAAAAPSASDTRAAAGSSDSVAQGGDLAKPAQAAKKPAQAKPRNGSGKPRVEPDTLLLAALVSHVQHTEAQARASQRPDVVLADHSATAAELVARCERLGGLEGNLCRKRICKELPGNNATCAAR
ncbi:hypothetical protein GCM10025771_22590 [Niveibacterium umoris]|uniref:Uncharacterized protein n=1 Tax=Niveibacterium umoris TaxID=1193620 RepID=A0A840BLN0_9RHOO|nr:hypothetical protein [Niveibacterium umoris]MBB4012552.1 hypothetical protein [Niveibacterium umoris]